MSKELILLDLNRILLYTAFFSSTFTIIFPINSKKELEQEENKEISARKIVYDIICSIFATILIINMVFRIRIVNSIFYSTAFLLGILYVFYIIQRILSKEKGKLEKLERIAVVCIPAIISNSVFNTLASGNLKSNILFIVIKYAFYISFISINVYLTLRACSKIKIKPLRSFCEKQIELKEPSYNIEKYYADYFLKKIIMKIKRGFLKVILHIILIPITFIIDITLGTIHLIIFLVYDYLIVKNANVIENILYELKKSFRKISVKSEKEDIYVCFRISLIVALVIGYYVINENPNDYQNVSELYNILAATFVIPLIFTQLTEK